MKLFDFQLKTNLRVFLFNIKEIKKTQDNFKMKQKALFQVQLNL